MKKKYKNKMIESEHQKKERREKSLNKLFNPDLGEFAYKVKFPKPGNRGYNCL